MCAERTRPRSRWLWLLLPALLALVLLGHCSDRLRGPPANLSLRAPRTVVWKNFLGVNAHFLWFAPDIYRKQIERLKALGLQWVRIDLHWDVVQIEHSYAFQPYATALARHRQPFVLTEHNVESSLSAATYRRLPVPLRQLACIDHWRYRRWERDVLRRATRLVALTTADAAAFKRLSGRSASLVVNGTETDAFAAVQPNPAAQRVMYVGNFEYAPNVDAVAWLLSEIMPRVWKRLPQARLSLCGHAMPATWRKRWPDPRIEWLGYVEQLAAVQARASAFVAPLRDGGGSKLKVIEAMAAGLPLASTAQGVSGLDVRDGVHFRQGDDAESLAAALAGLLQSPTEALRLGEAGRNYVREQHDWNISAAQLEAVYRELGDSHVGVPACA